MAEKAVTKYETKGALVQREADELDVFGQVTQDDLVLPVRKLVQAVSRTADTKHAGEFHDQITDTYKPSLMVAILAMSRSRSLFAAGSFDTPPVCVSDDSIKPRQQIECPDGTVTGPTCAECPFSQWGSARNGRGQECRLAYSLLLFDLEDMAPFIYRVSGTGLAGWKRYLTAGWLNKMRGYAVRTDIVTEERKFAAGKAYVPVFSASDEPLEPGLVQALREQAATWRGVSLGVEDAVEEPVAAPAAAEEDDLFQ